MGALEFVTELRRLISRISLVRAIVSKVADCRLGLLEFDSWHGQGALFDHFRRLLSAVVLN
jgi:hypothetical protein